MDFERMMESMEKSSENTVISLLDAKQLFSDVNHDTLAQIYDYWLNKRLGLVSLLYLVYNEICNGAYRYYMVHFLLGTILLLCRVSSVLYNRHIMRDRDYQV